MAACAGDKVLGLRCSGCGLLAVGLSVGLDSLFRGVGGESSGMEESG